MKKLLLLLLLPVLAFGQTPYYELHQLPATKNPSQIWGYISHAPNTGKLPLLIGLHGKGEYGDGKKGLSKLLGKDVGLGSLLAKGKVPVDSFIILLPQIAKGSFDTLKLEKFIKYAIKNYNVDSTRIYITGLSMGANSLYVYLRHHTVTAAVICAGQTSLYKPRVISACNTYGKTPSWIYHGDQDGTVPYMPDIRLASALSLCGADFKFTLLPGVGHNCWTAAYNNQEVYYWLLKHKTKAYF